MFLGWATFAAAESAPALTVDVPPPLRAGDHTTLIVRLVLPPGAGAPVLLTTASQGASLEVVRGRFVRLDAVDPDALTLRFDVPVVARAAGTAILRAHVLYYRCMPACVAVEQAAHASVEIAAGS